MIPALTRRERMLVVCPRLWPQADSAEQKRGRLRIKQCHDFNRFSCRRRCQRLAAGFAGGLVQPIGSARSRRNRARRGGLLPYDERSFRAVIARA